MKVDQQQNAQNLVNAGWDDDDDDVSLGDIEEVKSAQGNDQDDVDSA